MKKIVLIILLLAMSCVLLAEESWLIKNFSIASAIESVLPGAITLCVKDYDQKMIKYLDTYRLFTKSPGIVKADFNGDHKIDFACLIHSENGGPNEEVIFVIFLSDKTKYIKYLISTYDMTPPYYKWIESYKGRWAYMEDGKEVLMHDFKNTGILLCRYESDSTGIYWNSKTKMFEFAGME